MKTNEAKSLTLRVEAPGREVLEVPLGPRLSGALREAARREGVSSGEAAAALIREGLALRRRRGSERA